MLRCELRGRVVVLLHEFQLFLHGIASLSEEVELRADVLVFVIGRGGDLREDKSSPVEPCIGGQQYEQCEGCGGDRGDRTDDVCRVCGVSSCQEGDGDERRRADDQHEYSPEHIRNPFTQSQQREHQFQFAVDSVSCPGPSPFHPS